MLPVISEQKPFDGITVYTFSEGINQEDEELKGAKIVEKYVWKNKSLEQSGTSTAIRIYDGFKRVTEERTKKTIEDETEKTMKEGTKEKMKDKTGKAMKDGTKKTLKIVNMPPLADKLLKMKYSEDLKTNQFPKSILFIPEIQAPATKETLETLLHLRKHCVCITAAKRDSHEVSAAECIAVGVEPFTDQMITSGVLDFVLHGSECEGCHSLEDGAATAVGMIAGFLYKMGEALKGKIFKCRSKSIHVAV